MKKKVLVIGVIGADVHAVGNKIPVSYTHLTLPTSASV